MGKWQQGSRGARLVVAVVIAAVVVGTAGLAQATVVFDHSWGGAGAGDGQFTIPNAIAVDAAGSIYVADADNDRIQKFTSGGTFVTKWGDPGTADGQFDTPSGVAIDASGNVYVADTNNHRIQKFTSTGGFITKWGVSGTNDGEFAYPHGLAVDPAGNVYVADTSNDRIQKFTSAGTFITKWGTFGSGNGQLFGPRGVAVHAPGSVYVADTNNNRIEKFTDTGAFVTKWGAPGAGDAQFSFPAGVAVDSPGNVYVADTSNNRIQKFTDTGAFITQWGTSGDFDGEFDHPFGVAVEGSGRAAVADTGNNRIQTFDQVGSITILTDSINDHAQDFVFSLGPALAVLDDDADAALPNQVTFDGLAPGLFVAREAPTQGWALSSIVCDTGERIDLTNRRAIISLGIGEDVTCTFTNSQLGTITIVSHSDPKDAQDFAFTGDLGPFTLDDDTNATLPSQLTFTKPPGTYTVTESAPATGWALDYLTCAGGGTTHVPTRTATIMLPPGGSRICTFDNGKQVQPDAMIATALDGPYVGNNVYGLFLPTQSKQRTVARGGTGTYYVRIQNDSPFWTDFFRLTGELPTSGFTVHYYNATTGADITNAVLNTYSSPMVAPGAYFTVKITVKVATTATRGAKQNLGFRAQSGTRIIREDSVLAITTVA